jgi:carbon monoxide dehydrogenase subunit G
MATIRREIPIAAPPAKVWDAVQDFGAVHTRLAPGFVVDTKLEDGPARVVTFANGLVARELIVTVEEDARRLAYAIVGGAPTHHNASFQVCPDGAGGTTLIWLADLLPDRIAPQIAAMMDQGAQAMQAAMRAAR